MAGAQGLQPIDYFHTLQLDPTAPHALVVEVYGALVRRTRRTGTPARPLDALDVAYAGALATCAEATSVEQDGANHYATLHVDRHADEEVVRLAFDVLERTKPLPLNSLARHQRDEALRVLTNPQLRARYDQTLRPYTIQDRLRPVSNDAKPQKVAPRKERSVSNEKKRGFLGLGRSQAPEFDARDRRLLTLRAQLPLGPADVATEEEDVAPTVTSVAVAEVIFTGGPRAGMRVELDSNVLPLGDGKATATLWRHGDRFLLRHSGKQIRVGGTIPALSIVVLEDDDEIQVGNDRLRFLLAPASA